MVKIEVSLDTVREAESWALENLPRGSYTMHSAGLIGDMWFDYIDFVQFHFKDERLATMFALKWKN